MTLQDIAKRIENKIASHLDGCGIMFRMFSRVKSEASLAHKMEIKGEKYRSGQTKIQDMIGFRLVVYFTDDVNIVEILVNSVQVADRSIDEPDSITFMPQRLNIVCNLSDEYKEDFRKALPEEYATYIDTTCEVQIRTIFSEGWHEVEHDLRYKCKEDWVGYDTLSRSLNGVIATLETAEWGMLSIFKEMASQNLRFKNYSAMLRNKLRLRLYGSGLSPDIQQFLEKHHDIAEAAYEMDRTVLVLSLAFHDKHIKLTYDTVLFIMNRLEMHSKELMALESEEMKQQITEMLMS